MKQTQAVAWAVVAWGRGDDPTTRHGELATTRQIAVEVGRVHDGEAESMGGFHHDVIVIGAGYAGLTVSYFLQQRGIDHIVLEQGRVADTWRNQRWDTFTLVTPGWMNHLPGFSHAFGEEDFMPKESVVSYLESYAKLFGIPVQEGRSVTAVREVDGGGFAVNLHDEQVICRAVVVATGAMRHPKIPAWAEAIPRDVVQMHSADYRNSGQLEEGGVLVIGSGQSGCQIAEEILEEGRSVYLSVGKCGRMPRRYRGRDSALWLAQAGIYDRTVDMARTRDELRACGPYVSGKNGGHEINLRKLATQGLHLLGRCQGVEDDALVLADDLKANLEAADQFAAGVRRAIDEFIQRQEIDAPADSPEPVADESVVAAPPQRLRWSETGIKTVIWATGFRQEFSWIKVPVFDAAGSPVHRRGKTDRAGLYFIGLPWLYKLKSSLIYGIAEDAVYIADDLYELLTA